MLYSCSSASSNIKSYPQTDDDITLFMQFFIHSSDTRNHELQTCLRKNVENPFVSRIVMLNEREYSIEELGIYSPKIIQKIIGKRMWYDDVFHYVFPNRDGDVEADANADADIKGYYAIINSDIFFDNTLVLLQHSDIHVSRKMWALLRWEYKPDQSPEIYGPNSDSQDVWIFHTNHPLTATQKKIFRFPMGVPGCDNKMVYMGHLCGFEIVNAPKQIKTYHYHTSQERNYDQTHRLPTPYGVVYPEGYDPKQLNSCAKKDELMFDDNRKLYDYLERKMTTKRKFKIARSNTMEANMLYLFQRYNEIQQGQYSPETREQIQEKLAAQIQCVKKFAGVALETMVSVSDFCANYLTSFTHHCEMYGRWSARDTYMNTQHAEQWILSQTENSKDTETKTDTPTSNFQPTPIWAGVMDVFHYVYSPTPWTHALRGKRILLICSHTELVEKQIPIRDRVFGGIDLFPECTFITIPSPAQYGDLPSKDYMFVMKKMCKELDKVSKKYDVALIAAGGYSPYLVNYLYDCGKSAIVVGDALLLCFGLYYERFMKQRGDIFRV
jgi:hypothetical protein